MPRQGPLKEWMEHSKLKLASIQEGGLKNLYIFTETHDIFLKIYENTKTEDMTQFDTGHFHNFHFQGVLRPYLQRSTAYNTRIKAAGGSISVNWVMNFSDIAKYIWLNFVLKTVWNIVALSLKDFLYCHVVCL